MHGEGHRICHAALPVDEVAGLCVNAHLPPQPRAYERGSKGLLRVRGPVVRRARFVGGAAVAVVE
eukprot:14680311-Alexandrium_andersonii.AAC.1